MYLRRQTENSLIGKTSQFQNQCHTFNSADNDQHRYHCMIFILSFCNIAICPHFLVGRRIVLLVFLERGFCLISYHIYQNKVKFRRSNKCLFNTIILVGVGKRKTRTGLLWGSPISPDMFHFQFFFPNLLLSSFLLVPVSSLFIWYHDVELRSRSWRLLCYSSHWIGELFLGHISVFVYVLFTRDI